MKAWADADWWWVRCELLNDPGHAALVIQDKKRELERAIYRESPAGRPAERNAQMDRLLAACHDKAFQEFRARLTALGKKRG